MHEHHGPSLDKRVSDLERAVYGYIDETTRMIVPGILQNTADTKKAVDAMVKGDNAAAQKGQRDRRRIFRAVLGVGLVELGNLAHNVAPHTWDIVHTLFGGH